MQLGKHEESHAYSKSLYHSKILQVKEFKDGWNRKCVAWPVSL